MSEIRVTFTDEEMYKCVQWGGKRTISALNKGRKGAHGFNRDYERWSIDIEGVATELAAAKALGLPYEPVVGSLDTDLGDIAPGLQVRGTRYPQGSLLIHKSDHDEDRFILVTGVTGDYRVRGWIKAGDGKIDSLYREYKGRWAYWVGQNWLKPMSELVVPK
jgi:hypothetical protein